MHSSSLALSLALGLLVGACSPSPGDNSPQPDGGPLPPTDLGATDASPADVTGGALDAPSSDAATAACSATAGPGCTADQYCAGDACSTLGHCVPRPPMCTMTSTAVCGCDGHTYANPCAAAMTGVRVASMGACTSAPDAGPSACVSNLDCAPTELCDATDCGSPGTCVPRPTDCSAIYTPVCGCDGQTYANMCVARAAGARVATRGMCAAADGGAALDAGTALDTGTAGDTGVHAGADAVADTGIAGPCMNPSDCRPGAYCAGSACGAPGLCAPRPGVCTDIHDPVCGCDGYTYGNACAAASVGVRVASPGACVVPDAGRPACLGVFCVIGSRCCTVPGAMRFGMCYPTSCVTCCIPPSP